MSDVPPTYPDELPREDDPPAAPPATRGRGRGGHAAETSGRTARLAERTAMRERLVDEMCEAADVLISFEKLVDALCMLLSCLLFDL